MLRKLSGLAIVLVLLLGLSAPVLAQGDEVVIRYANFTAGQEREAELSEIIAAFEAENPNITIEPYNMPFGDYFTLLQADFVGGDPPDVFELNYENFVAFAANGVLLDVGEYVSEDAPYYPEALEAFQYQDTQYALPETFSTVVMIYNKDLFDQAGIDYPGADWTWADALEAAHAIRDLGEDIWGIYSPIQFWEFYKRAAQNNCQFFNEDKTESLINTPECVEALQVMMSLLEEDVMPDPAEQAGVGDSELFQEGRLGMQVTGIWMIPAYQEVEFEWDIQLEPGMATRAYHFFSNGVAVSNQTEHPAEAAAWAQFLTASKTAVDVRLAANWELPTLNDMSLFEVYLEQSPPDNREVVFESLEAPVPPPTIPQQSEMQDIFDELLNAVIAGDLDAETALNMAKEEIDLLLQQ